MTVSRITQQTMGRQAFANLQSSLGRLHGLEEQLSSGKQIRKPSDSPVGTVAAMRYRTQMDRTAQYARNIDDGIGWLALADTTLTNASDQLRRVRDLTLNGTNASLGPEARVALADEVDAIRDALVQLANTTYLGRPIFGGTTGAATAFSPAGTFLGDTAVVSRTIAPGESVQVSMAGPAVWGSDATGVFATLGRISADLRSNPAGLAPDLTALDQVTGALRSQLALVGTSANRLEQAQLRNSDTETTMRQRLSEVEDIDLARTALELKIQETSYQAALAATSRVIQPSLVDFLR
jgi:flagellar hook-associated protein 3 FlgL